MRSVTRKPPTTLIVPKATAITSSSLSSVECASPSSRMPPSTTIPWIALVADISGVWSVFGTREMTSKPTKAAITSSVISVTRSIGLPGHTRLRQHFVIPVQVEVALVVDHQLDQRLHVARVHHRGRLRHLGRQVERRDDRHVVLDDGLA